MIEIDGAQKSGSGTIVRYAVAMAALLGQPLHLFNARARRRMPGLRPQHVSAVKACAELCGARVEGLGIGCGEFTLVPTGRITGGEFIWNIGTAGSTTMLALSVLPVACFADGQVIARIEGGVFQDFAPSPHHMQQVLAPLLERMGLRFSLDVIRAGYVPRGSGVIELRVTPAQALRALDLPQQGQVLAVAGIAFSSHLAQRHVSERMAQSCRARLAEAGLTGAIECVEDQSALHAGACLAIWANTSTDCRLGADQAGAPGRTSEAIGWHVAESLLADLQSGATVDRYVADQLVLMAAAASGTSRYRIPHRTEHLESNLWLAEIFGATVAIHEREVVIKGLGVVPRT